METKDLDRIKELEDRCGNRYLAVRFIANAARKLGKEKKARRKEMAIDVVEEKKK